MGTLYIHPKLVITDEMDGWMDGWMDAIMLCYAPFIKQSSTLFRDILCTFTNLLKYFFKQHGGRECLFIHLRHFDRTNFFFFFKHAPKTLLEPNQLIVKKKKKKKKAKRNKDIK